ncbi:MAG: hypothetical protein ACREFE_16685, partial [Limisphaerales bacterium]
MNNVRQLGLAIQMYAQDNRDYLPWINWGDNPLAGAPPGWLYSQSPLPHSYTLAVYNLNPENFEKACLNSIKGGLLYQYAPNVLTFRCPLDPPGPSNPHAAEWAQRGEQLSSYIMNGWAGFLPPETTGGASKYNYKTAKITQIWNMEAYVMWETDPSNPGLFNDGANDPSKPGEGLGRAHIIGGLVLEVGGVAKWIKYDDFHNLVTAPAGTRNLALWQIKP